MEHGDDYTRHDDVVHVIERTSLKHHRKRHIRERVLAAGIHQLVAHNLDHHKPPFAVVHVTTGVAAARLVPDVQKVSGECPRAKDEEAFLKVVREVAHVHFAGGFYGARE